VCKSCRWKWERAGTFVDDLFRGVGVQGLGLALLAGGEGSSRD